MDGVKNEEQALARRREIIFQRKAQLHSVRQKKLVDLQLRDDAVRLWMERQRRSFKEVAEYVLRQKPSSLILTFPPEILAVIMFNLDRESRVNFANSHPYFSEVGEFVQTTQKRKDLEWKAGAHERFLKRRVEMNKILERKRSQGYRPGDGFIWDKEPSDEENWD